MTYLTHFSTQAEHDASYVYGGQSYEEPWCSAVGDDYENPTYNYPPSIVMELSDGSTKKIYERELTEEAIYSAVSSYWTRIKKVWMHSNIVSITGSTSTSTHPFTYATSLWIDWDVPDYFFMMCNCSSVTFAPNCKVIGTKSFSECQRLNTIRIPASVQEIKSAAFSQCNHLTSVFIDANNLLMTRGSTFSYCRALSHVKLPDVPFNSASGLAQFGACPKLTNIVIPPTWTTLPFSLRGMKDGVKSVLMSGIKNIEFPEGITSIPDHFLIYNNSVEKIILPSTVKTISEGEPFGRCFKLKELVLNEGLETIGGSAVQYCPALKRVIIPSTVKTIGSFAFYKSTPTAYVESDSPQNENLMPDVYAANYNGQYEVFIRCVNPPALDSASAFNGASCIYVPAESVDIYKEAPVWKTASLAPIKPFPSWFS